MTIVSVIICTRDRCESLAETLKAIDAINRPDDMCVELVVVDNGSSDNTAQVVHECCLREMDVRYVLEPSPGLSKARNRGLASARGEIILFTDDDIVPPPNWIEGMCRPIVDNNADATAGGVRLAAYLLKPWMTVVHRRFLASSEEINPASPKSMVGANMAFSRNVLTRVPGFDTELGSGALGFGEDYMFASSLLAAGYRLMAVLDVAVEHRPSVDRLKRAAYLKAADRSGRTLGYMFHHVQHMRRSAVNLHILKQLIKLGILRFIRKPYHKEEGIPLWEFEILQSVGMLRQYKLEKMRPYRYEANGVMLPPDNKGDQKFSM